MNGLNSAPSRKNRFRSTIVYLLALCFAGAVCMTGYRAVRKASEKKPEPPQLKQDTDVAVIVLKARELVDEIFIPASVFAYEDVTISSEVAGRVRKITGDGARVRKGETVLLELDDRELAADVAARKADLDASKAALAELEAGALSEEIAQAEANLARCLSEEKRIRDDYLHEKDLFEKKVSSLREYDAAKTAYEVAQTRVRDGRDQLALLKKGPRRERIDQARARVAQAEAVLDQAQTRFQRATVASPITGRVNLVLVHVGEWINVGQPLMNLVDDTRVKVYGVVPEKDIGFIHENDPVQVIWKGPTAERRFSGKLDFVAVKAQERSRTYPIRTVFENSDFFFRDGMIVTMQVTRSRIPDAILVPLFSVMPRETGYVVFLEKDGRAIERHVEPGIMKDRRLHIRSGLKPGDRLIVMGQRELVDGQNVKVQKVDTE